ncbi:MAG: hypothetical protein K8R35_03345 [Bacteroidales bacterium]|nr:hypothetical protein [Bacteroidales bacterium]
MFLTLLLLSAIILVIAIAAMAIRILIKKDGKFPSNHIGQNREMRKRGIKCAQAIDVGKHKTDGFPGCTSCGD